MSCFEVVHFFQHGQALIASQGLHVVHILAIEVIQDPVPLSGLPYGQLVMIIAAGLLLRLSSKTNLTPMLDPPNNSSHDFI